MTRPNIVRADTIDLQDEDHPTAAEHQKPSFDNGLAPHQRSEVHHVLKERTSEEHALQDAWNGSGEMTEEPETMDQSQQDKDTQPTTDGTHQGEESEGGESDADEDMMDRISSSPSIDDEDIDFEFVYALHTFVATVEGQANATKGDTMVLLDDSNSYWWLVRVVKDSSIGYLPAEHIETPTERLARLNKHRNIDLSATMLSDNSEKSRNPLKKAIRRRNAKTVQFAAPTYVEASDYDYESEDEEQPSNEPPANAVQAEEAQQNGEANESDQAEERRSSSEEAPRAGTPTQRHSFDREQAATIASNAEDPQLSPKLVDKTEAAPLKSRKTRNTDSFLKDDSIETRKITLTPGLLREDSLSGKSASSESVRNNSLENLVKQVSPPEQISKKDSKKEKKEKKGGMLSGLFKSKKKDKKSKDDLDHSEEKPSSEFMRESPRASPLTSGRSSPIVESSGVSTPVESRRQEVQTRQPSRGKLQKQPPTDTSSPARETQQEQPTEKPETSAPRSFVAELEGSEAAHEMGSAGLSPIDTQAAQASDDKQKDGPLSPITNILKRDDSKTQKPAKAKRSKQRVELDDFDSPVDEEGDPNPFKEQEERAAANEGGNDADRLSESPVEISQNTFMHGTEIVHIPTPGPYEQGDSEEDDDDEPASLTSSPSIIEHPAEPAEPGEGRSLEDSDATPTGPRSPQPGSDSANTRPPVSPNRGLSTDSTATSSSTHLSPATTVSQQSWSDSSLRAWLEDGSEVKDMMTMIYDKSGVVPVSDNHPLMAGLFSEQKKGVEDMMGQLDGLLGSYLQRKGIALS